MDGDDEAKERITHVIIWIKNPGNVLAQVSLHDCSDVISVVN